MSLHLYCVVPPEHQPEGVAGIDGQEVALIAAGTVACWVSTHAERPQPDAAAVTAHNAVVTAAMNRTVTPVPLRFGHFLDDAAAVRAHLQSDTARWTALLASFAGHAEFGVRVAGATSARHEELHAARDVHAAARHTGRDYMEALARRQAAAAHRQAEAGRIGAAFQERAGGVIRDQRSDTLDGRTGIVALAHLVAWRDVDAYHAFVREVRAEFTAVRFVCTGPWPPYSFVT